MKRIMMIIAGVLLAIVLLLWALSQRTFPVTYGISFSKEYAEALELNWQEVYTAMLTDLQPTKVRIAATWKEVEATQGTYDFGDIDWQMDQAEEHGAKVLLVVGQKAPRWPECHIPSWVEDTAEEKDQLLGYVRAVVERYKDHPALELWQVENEPFIQFTFGECENYHKEYIHEEIDLVRSLDPDKKIVVTDSGELGLWYKAANTGDIFGTTLYRIVRTPKNHIWTYDWLPPAFYYLRAHMFGVDLDNFFVAELQAEPWFGEGNPHDSSIEEQEETMNPKRLEKHIEYVTHMGVSRTYLWGAEWWYFMKNTHNDARYWDIVKETLKK
ncbi:beta-galactosidase [Patescibacteria group bacterium]|nr:beta-galactosidase [Patescibacteria group bacterium]MBU1722043.1 beta-galactosidase [Patescibacteria group bacterium]MBU1901513.1 beta-galactosidase [Patescibacteria group bacterium]